MFTLYYVYFAACFAAYLLWVKLTLHLTLHTYVPCSILTLQLTLCYVYFVFVFSLHAEFLFDTCLLCSILTLQHAYFDGVFCFICCSMPKVGHCTAAPLPPCFIRVATRGLPILRLWPSSCCPPRPQGSHLPAPQEPQSTSISKFQFLDFAVCLLCLTHAYFAAYLSCNLLTLMV